MGNISLSDITLTCAATKGTGSAPHWIGVVKEMYQKEEQGNIFKPCVFLDLHTPIIPLLK